MKRALGITLLPIIAAATLTACGDDKDSGSMPGHSMSSSAAPSTTQNAQHNEQDVMFAQMMIPHHRQAIEMAELAARRASMPEVKKLAADIQKAQDPEIQQMTGWLTSWGKSPPPTDMGHGGMEHGGMQGMMSEQDMKKLESLSGTAFDKAFLEMMIKHHEGAIEMAKKEQTAGQHAPAKTMANNIVSSQATEIATMRNLLKQM